MHLKINTKTQLMSKSQETYSKKEKEKKRLKKKKEKDEKRQERKANATEGTLDNMMAYIDENGNISDTPPDPENKIEFELDDIITSIPKQEEFDMEAERKGKIDFFNTDKGDRKSTRLNSSHDQISYAVFCLKKKKFQPITDTVTSHCTPYLTH